MAGLYVWLGVLFAQRWASPLVKVMAIVLLGLASIVYLDAQPA